jgi:hypothetical protein
MTALSLPTPAKRTPRKPRYAPSIGSECLSAKTSYSFRRVGSSRVRQMRTITAPFEQDDDRVPRLRAAAATTHRHRSSFSQQPTADDT